MTRNPWRLNAKRTHFHKVSCPHSATHPSRSTTPGLCLPESRCVPALTMCLDALLPRRTPWCPFNQVRSRDNTLQSFTWQRSPSPLGGASPLAISATAVGQTVKPAFLAPPRDWQSRRHAPRTNRLRLVPLGSMALGAFGALGIAAAAASLQGFHPSAGWGAPSPDFSTCGVPGSPGLHPPWGVPLPEPRPPGCNAGLAAFAATPHCGVRLTAEPECVRPPLTLRGAPVPGTVPCASSFKELGS